MPSEHTINETAAEVRIQQIMRDFNFDKVQGVMQFLGWKWHLVGVPSIGELRACARELLTYAAADRRVHSYASGGFIVDVLDDGLALSFVLEAVETD